MMDGSLIILVGATFVSGFIDAIVGGGGLISVPVLMSLGLPPQSAVASNKLIGISTATAGCYKYIRAKAIIYKDIKGLIPFSLTGAIIGGYCLTQTDPDFLRKFIFFAICGLCIYLLFSKNIEQVNKPKPSITWLLPICILTLGFYDGFFGPGTGTFLIMTLLFFQRYSLLQAGATARILNFCSNLVAVIYFSTTGLIEFAFVVPAMFSSFIGGYAGASYSVRYGSRGIKPMLYISVTALLIKLWMDL